MRRRPPVRSSLRTPDAPGSRVLQGLILHVPRPARSRFATIGSPRRAGAGVGDRDRRPGWDGRGGHRPRRPPLRMRIALRRGRVLLRERASSRAGDAGRGVPCSGRFAEVRTRSPLEPERSRSLPRYDPMRQRRGPDSTARDFVAESGHLTCPAPAARSVRRRPAPPGRCDPVLDLSLATRRTAGTCRLSRSSLRRRPTDRSRGRRSPPWRSAASSGLRTHRVTSELARDARSGISPITAVAASFLTGRGRFPCAPHVADSP